MNFDDIKKQWDSQSQDEIKVNVDLNKVLEANSIIDNVRKVMKKDFFFQLTVFPVLFTYPFIFYVNTAVIWFIIVCFSIVMLFPLIEFYKFYKESYRLEYNSLRNLNWFYYSYKHSVTLFRVYSYIVVVLIMMLIGVIFFEKDPTRFNHYFNDVFSVAVGTVILFSAVLYMVFGVWVTKWWIDKLYAKPLSQIKQLLDDLEE